MPRFVVDDGRLVLVRGPYAVPSDVYVENARGLSEPLQRHLRAYDRFYFAARHEIPPLIGDLVLHLAGLGDSLSHGVQRLSRDRQR